ncbi:MAG TPA: VWA domain-containing protein, partial [Quisquiliibacterium sp.]|nr:VWA domain-containing protein [Quisquiliibacterium sp.]
ACPSHPARVHRHPDGATVSLEGSLDRDFVVTVDGLQARPLASLAPDGDGWVALASFLPPSPAEPAPEAGLRVKLLVDCSGSMAGDSIAQARRAVARLLEKLGDRDQVDLSRFGSSVQHFHAMERATREHLARCRRWARALQADLGGTELLAALSEVFERGQPGDGAGDGADVFLITDGEVHEADEIVALARQHRQRVFVVGVGSAPNESLLQRLAAQTGGSAELVTPTESIEDALMRLFARLRQPRVTGLAVDWPAQPDWSVPLPGALWAGETAHVIARFPGRPAGAATLRWREAGPERRMSIALPAIATTEPPADDPGASSGEAAPGDALARLAAGLAVSSLPDEERGAFAERYQLVTDRTSMALVMQREGDARAQGLPEHVKIPQMLAAGWGGHGTVLLESACYAPAPDAYFSAESAADFADDQPTVFRHPSSASAILRAFLDSRSLAGIDELAEQVAQLLAQAPRGSRDGAPWLTLDALRPLLPPELEQALDEALLEHIAGAPGEAELVAWLVVDLARRCPTTAFPRAALRELRARSRGVVAPQPVVDALDALASGLAPSEPDPIPAFLRRAR